jgi:hypothetical protein
VQKLYFPEHYVVQDGQDNDKRVAISTDSKITLDLLQNKFKRNRLVEFIRNKIIALAHLKWTVLFGGLKGHAGVEGNELVYRLAKEAAVEDCIRRDAKRGDYNARGGKWFSCVAVAVEDYGEGGSDQSFFPVSEE